MTEESRRDRAEERADQRHSRRRRIVAVLVALALVVLGGVGYAWWRLEGNISRLDLSGQLATNRPTAKATGPGAPLNILLIGSDKRAGEDVPDAKEFSGARSDTTLIAHVSADRKHVTVVSIPRDSLVPMPPRCNIKTPKSQWPDQQFNAAFSIGGPACLINTIEQNTGLRIDHFAVVDFNGFRAMVDALGGVPVCTPTAINDKKAHLQLAAGRHVLDGTQALGYVRVRYTEGDGSDLGRIKRQQAFLSSIVQEATRSSLLLRPDKLFGFLDAATKSLTTDEDFDLGTMKDLADSVKNIGIKNVVFLTVPTEYSKIDPNRVVWTPAAEGLWQTLIDDGVVNKAPSASSTPSPTSTALTVTPDAVSVQVVNATGVSGLASQAAAALKAQGFAKASVTSVTARPTGVTVEYGPDRADAARTVAAAFPGARLKANAELGSTVVVTLGAGSPAVVEVPNRLGTGSLPAQPITAPTPSPTATLETRSAAQDICS